MCLKWFYVSMLLMGCHSPYGIEENSNDLGRDVIVLENLI